MEITKISPKVLSLEWGVVDIEGYGQFKNVKLYPGGARKWDWNETGTEHEPGVQVADAEELIEHGAQVLILTQGMLGALKVPAETVAALEARGVTVHMAKTPEAIELYDQLRGDKAVGILIHSTC